MYLNVKFYLTAIFIILLCSNISNAQNKKSVDLRNHKKAFGDSTYFRNNTTDYNKLILFKTDSIFVKVKKDDWLSKIAGRYYNDIYDWVKIYEINKDKIKNPDIILPGMKLLVIINRYREKTPEEYAALTPKTITTKKKIEEFEFGGLVVDETQSKIGHDFFELFYSKWTFPDAAKSFNIIMSEKPMPSMGTQISLRVNDEEILQQFVQPKGDLLEEMSDYFVQYTSQYIENYELIQSDLNGTDLKGTGIY